MIDDLVVEVDLLPNTEGMIPALKIPAHFKIAPLQDYLESKEEPSWLAQIEDPAKLEESRKETMSCLEQMGKEMAKSKANKCMLLVNYTGGPSFQEART